MLSGDILETLEGLKKYDPIIVGEVELKIQYHLIGKCQMAEAKKLLAHPHSFKQCEKTLRKMGLKCPVDFTKSNGYSREIFIQENDPHILAIIPVYAVGNLPIVQKHIEDDTENATRFILLRKRENLQNQK